MPSIHFWRGQGWWECNSIRNTGALLVLSHLLFKTIPQENPTRYAPLSTDEEVEAPQGKMIWPDGANISTCPR